MKFCPYRKVVVVGGGGGDLFSHAEGEAHKVFMC